MLFFSEDGLLMYSDGQSAIKLFDNNMFRIDTGTRKDWEDERLDKLRARGVKIHTGESLSRNWNKKGKLGRTPGGDDAYMSDDEFAAIEPAGVDEKGNSKATHTIRPDKSKSSGRIFGMNGKQFVHSNDCDDEFADIEGNECKSGRVRSSGRSCKVGRRRGY